MRHRTRGLSDLRVVVRFVPAAVLLAAAFSACSGSGGTANTAPSAPTPTPSPTPITSTSPSSTPTHSPTPSPTPTASPTHTPTPTPTPTASPTRTPTPTPSPTTSAAPDLFTVGCQVGSNYIDFENASNTYVPAPGYGQLTIGTNLGQFSSLGITTGETGQIQSLNEGTGVAISIVPFITFNGAGSQYTLNATYIPPGQTAGPFTVVDNGNGTSTATFEVDGNIENGGFPTGNGFRIFFSATFPFPAATLFTNLPQDTTCIATSADVLSLSHGSHPLSRH
jgi:hypothetical protein